MIFKQAIISTVRFLERERFLFKRKPTTLKSGREEIVYHRTTSPYAGMVTIEGNILLLEAIILSLGTT